MGGRYISDRSIGDYVYNFTLRVAEHAFFALRTFHVNKRAEVTR